MKNGNATILRITPGGIVYARDTASDRIAGFTFGKLPNYHGESAEELNKLGIKPGKEISVEYDEKDLVRSVKLVPAQ